MSPVGELHLRQIKRLKGWVEQSPLGPWIQWLLQRPRLALGLGVAFGAIGIGLLFVPPLKSMRSAEHEYRGLKSQMEEARGILEEFRRGAFPSLPWEKEAPELLSRLNLLAREHGVELKELNPGTPREGAPDEPSILPVELQAEGEYRSIGEFLGRLSQDPALGAASIRQLKIDREQNLLPRLKARATIELYLRSGWSGLQGIGTSRGDRAEPQGFGMNPGRWEETLGGFDAP